MNVNIYAPTLEPGRALIDYVGGIMDSLDGSHGTHFTYLPIIYNDDCQVCLGAHAVHNSADEYYTVDIEILANKPLQPTRAVGPRG
jgi:hypothetical protein